MSFMAYSEQPSGAHTAEVTATTSAAAPAGAPRRDHVEGDHAERDRAPIGDDSPDFWMAIVAGVSVWADPDEPVPTLERFASAIELGSLAWCVTMIWVGSYVSDRDIAWAGVVGTVGACVIAIRPMRSVFGNRGTPPLALAFSVRVVMVLAIGVAGLLAGPLFGFLVSMTVAFAFGIEAALSAWTIGVPIEPAKWGTQFLRSPLHLGVVGAVVGAAVSVSTDSGVRTALTVYVMFLVSVVGGIAVAWGLDRFRLGSETMQANAVAAAVAAEHRERAHWLHDDVSSELKLVQLRLRTESTGPDDVASQLGDLDHRLRLRQLDELFASGSVNLAEVIQPFVRRAQSVGLEITDVPTFDDAGATVDERVGRLFARAANVVTSNAIEAGATRLAIRVASDSSSVTLTVTDDAGGFALAAAPAGRGLWQLRDHAEVDDVRVESTEHGSCVTVRIRRHRTGARPAPTAGATPGATPTSPPTSPPGERPGTPPSAALAGDGPTRTS
jgi:hypothetical protein